MKRVLCIGCSWSQHYGKYITDFPVEIMALNGAGLPQIRDRLNVCDLSGYSRIIVQLPTPIRSFPAKDAHTTALYHKEFLRSGWPSSQLWFLYLEELEQIARLGEHLIFFLYNVGGYPFRHPFDFGETADSSLLCYLQRRGFHATSVCLEGEAGFARQEIKADAELKAVYQTQIAKKLGYEDRFVFQHPPDHVILDAHPNETADRRAGLEINRCLTIASSWEIKHCLSDLKSF